MRAALAAVVALTLGCCVSACGGGGSSSGPSTTMAPVAYVKTAAKKTSTQTSEHLVLRGTTSVRQQAFTFSGRGDFDTPNKRGTLHLDMNAGGIAIPIDATLDGSTLYMRSPVLADALPQGKTWFSFDLKKGLAASGIDLSALGAQRPSDTLAQMQAAGTARKVGDESVGGVETTHYRGTIDPSKLAQAAKVKTPANARFTPYDVWIGKDDGLVHRIRYGYAAAGSKLTVQMDFSDFGKDVKVDVPAASETFDATNKAINGLGG